MAWIESHQELERHPKVSSLCVEMGWTLDETLGKLHRFWWWCLSFAPDGQLSKFNDGQLASAVGLNPDQGKKFVDAMVASRWIDREPSFRVHDWVDYAGIYLRDSFYKRKPEAWEEVRKSYRGPPSSPLLVRRQSAVPTNQPTDQPTRRLVGKVEVPREEPADFSPERENPPLPRMYQSDLLEPPKADDVPGPDGPGWLLWVKVWEGVPPAARNLCPAQALSRLERHAKDANVSPRLEGAMRAFRANGQIRNKTLENFLDPKHFNACLGKAAEHNGDSEKKRLADIKYCVDWLTRFVRDGQRLQNDEERTLVRGRAEFLKAQNVALPNGFRMPENTQ